VTANKIAPKTHVQRPERAQQCKLWFEKNYVWLKMHQYGNTEPKKNILEKVHHFGSIYSGIDRK
jgi:hypothetical protein